MIAAKDLRIGNWLVRDGRTCKVNMICDPPNEKRKTIQAEGKHIGVNAFFKEFEPIELTEDILVKCGFVKRGMKEWSDFELNITDDFFYFRISLSHENKLLSALLCGNGGYDDGGETELMQVLKYLHQLQNLYYCLTGNELEIQLT